MCWDAHSHRTCIISSALNFNDPPHSSVKHCIPSAPSKKIQWNSSHPLFPPNIPRFTCLNPYRLPFQEEWPPPCHHCQVRWFGCNGFARPEWWSWGSVGERRGEEGGRGGLREGGKGGAGHCPRHPVSLSALPLSQVGVDDTGLLMNKSLQLTPPHPPPPHFPCSFPSTISFSMASMESRFSSITGSDASSIFMEPIHLSSAVAAKKIINEGEAVLT